MDYNRNDILDIFYKAGLGKIEYFTAEYVEYEFWDKLQKESNMAFETYYVGATKAVFIPKNTSEYVIKIPFNAHEYEDEDEGYITTEKFCFANGDYNDWDYCAVESERYFVADGYDLGNFFAPTFSIGEVRDYPVYLQQRCFRMNKAQVSSKASQDKARMICDSSGASNYLKIDFEWLGAVLEYYGEESVEELVNFLKAQGWDDFHASNVGFYHEKPIIFDYSDYNE